MSTTLETLGDQTGIRCVLMRGGTSKGLYLHNEDLPLPGPRRDLLLQRLMGSPDVVQIDGLGGSRPITSKIAIVSASQRADADVDYTFVQVAIDTNGVGYSGNCGNISSGVGPFAVDEGLVAVTEGNTRVRIFNTNTNAVIVSDVPVHNGKARVVGSYVVPGVPGAGAEIAMNWVGTVGAKTGQLLPTGKAVDSITLEDGRDIEFSIVDAANPLVFVHAEDFGISGSELVNEINNNTALIDAAREARGKAAQMIGLCADWKKVDTESPGLPMLAFIAPPEAYKTLNGQPAPATDMDLRSRVVFMNKLHESVPGTGSICLAAASRVKGSVVEMASAKRNSDALLIGTPSGITPALVTSHETADAPFVAFDTLGFSRTARRLMQSTAYYPTDVFDILEDRTDIVIQNRGAGVVHEE
ncbi:2-methylaconitate cis-trans isomerase PrpF family protein [Streptomyces sp. NPDC060065]|uniref:2-methylaconitate cis-trans isomerase PrpF family protein n=1 Tax=Streptomyces sp. NPDC060065 TaxID=3347050 RepID=UPI0036781BB6